MSEVLDRPRGVVTCEARRERLCEAAAGVFLRDGYAAASMDEVARAAGMSKRTLYQVYPSKAALFEATIAATLVPIALDAEHEPDLRRALAGILTAAAGHLLAARQIGIFRLVIGERQRSPELAAATHRVLTSRGSSALERRLSAEVAAGRLRLSNPAAAARMLYGMVLGSAQMRLLLGVRDPLEAQEIEALAGEAVRIFLDGVAVRVQDPAGV
ncbi:TetR/AcrR family transcriptional regulator [Roseomonas fluvialis]|uniref:TetR family transcriptional regulator n=1 Tax=Roseomonas fluvialis TaxID=1750527 RepID=A0ABM7XYA5_9PROT|nr:TetR/AcrR family transcriptional regulator [Roseomonas fluvialis]BDG70415.1 TetR family transcriptional regulator [Roseomonas fluvialis]